MPGTTNRTTDMVAIHAQDKTDGSPRDHLCANTGSATTATSSLVSRDIKTIDLIPLHLIPTVVASAVRCRGRALDEVYVRRSGRHSYAVTVMARREEA